MTIAICVFIVSFAFALVTGFPLLDCHPDKGASQSVCIRRGCIWSSQATLGKPWCTYPSTGAGFPGYNLVSRRKTDKFIKFRLSRRNTPSLFGRDHQFITAEITVVQPGTVRLKIQDAMKTQKTISGHRQLKRHRRRHKISDAQLSVNYTEAPFGLQISTHRGQRLFNSVGLPGLTFAEQFLQISTIIPDRLFGLGEHVHESFRRSLSWKRWRMFALDHAPRGNHMNLYGSFPFYMTVDDNNLAHGVYLANSHATEVALQPKPNLVTLRTIGGILDLYLFTGPTPDDVVSQFTQLVGRPILPPYWGLGFQLCRYGYKNLTFLEQIFDRNRRAKIPQDIQYTDIDYMDDLKDFTVDSKRYQGFQGFLTKLHSMNMKYVPIVDPGISATAKHYPPLADGIESNIFIASGLNKSLPFTGKCWTGPTYWPDFTKASTLDYWLKQHKAFRQLAKFDGVWNDMNEPSNMISGEVKTGCAKNELNNPPYNPLPYDDINQNTVCMDAFQHVGRHYEMHNLYGYTEGIMSNMVMKRLIPGKRPFVLSRSTFAGSGKYVAHWTGDIPSTWDHLKWSIVSMLDFNLFGIPWVGADICGFDGNTNEDLCVRWQQLGAFYPFSRNHNSIENTVEQDPAAWSSKAVEAIRDVLLLRYYFLPYLYTLMYESHAHGKPVVRALFYSYPDNKTYDISDQFLWGETLMIAPITEPNSESRDVYFPAGIWFRYYDGAAFMGNQTIQLPIPYGQTGLYIYWGSIYPVQVAGMTTAESRKNNFGLIIANGPNGKAFGKIYLDDGESLDSIWDGIYSVWKLSFEQNVYEFKLILNPEKSGYNGHLDFLKIYGVDVKPNARVLVGSVDVTKRVNWSKNAGVLMLNLPRVTLVNAPVTIKIKG